MGIGYIVELSGKRNGNQSDSSLVGRTRDGVLVVRSLIALSKRMGAARNEGAEELIGAIQRYTPLTLVLQRLIEDRASVILPLLEVGRYRPLNLRALVERGHLRLDG
jgi:hypothetical protein